MTFLVCLAKLRDEGKIDRERADRFAREYQRLHANFAKQVGEVAAEDLATREAMDALEFQALTDRLLLKLPVFGSLVEKATIARWARTLSTLSAAGVPLVEALGNVGGASGNIVFAEATEVIRREVRTGTSLTVAMQNTQVFPSMVIQMVSIGEESGALDSMLSKVADFFEAEVDDAVEALSSLMEPMIMVVLGTLIGGMVIAMYLPIFKLGAVV